LIELRGITWDHVRGWGGLRAAAHVYERARDVRVTWSARSLRAFADQAVADLTAYDLIVLDHPSIGAAVGSGALVPLDEHLDGPFLEEQAASSVGRSFESYAWNGRQWALAVDAAAQVAAFRPDLMSDLDLEVPRTWEDVIRAAGRLAAHGRFVAIPSVPVDAICAFLAVCVELGEMPFNDPERVVDPATGRASLELLRAAVTSAHPESLTWNPPRSLTHMSEHDDVAYSPLAYGYVSYAIDGFAPHVLRFGPGPAGGDGVPRGTLGGAGLAVSSLSSHVEDACAYAAFVASPEVQRGVYVEGGGQPGHRAAWTDDRVNHGAGNFFADTLPALDSAFLRPRHDGFLTFQRAAGDVVHAWLREGGDAGVVLDTVDANYRYSLRAQATEIDR
jgi:multiple sugar transport system substrate-binding protein